MLRKIFFAIIFCSAPLFAQSQTDWAKVHTTTMEAIEHLYNMRYAEAEQKCSDVIKMAPGDPRGHFFRAMINYRKYEFSGDKSDYEKFVSASYRVEKVCENLLKKNENDSKAMFYQGGILGYRGLAKFGNGDNIGAVWDGKKAYGLLEDALELDSTNRDAQMGFGLFNYLISQAPDYIRPALKLAGVGGNKYLGLKLLESAAANGIYTKAEARSWLAGFYRNEENYSRSHQHYTWLINNFPENGWFRIRFGNLLLYSMRRGDELISQGKNFLELAAKLNHSDKNDILAYVNAGMGMAYYYKNDFDMAQEYFRKASAANANETFTRDMNYMIGLSLELAGKRNEALGYYQKASSRQDAQERMKKPFTQEEILEEKTDNFFRGGYYDQAIALAEPAIQKENLPDGIRAALHYTLGRAYYEKANFQSSEEQFKKVFSVKSTTQTWLPPYSYYRLGLAQFKAGNKNSAKENFEKALSYEGYEQEEYLRRLVNRELARLKKG